MGNLGSSASGVWLIQGTKSQDMLAPAARILIIFFSLTFGVPQIYGIAL